jgi:hypothetical protein
MMIGISVLIRMRNISDKFGENIKTHILCSVTFSENRAVNEMTWKYRSFATTVSQLKISDLSGEKFKGFEVLYFSMSATTTQLLSSG